MVIQIRGFEEYLLIIYRSSENMVFQPDDIGFTENVLIEVANARENRQHFTLDLNSNREIIKIVSNLDNILYIKPVTNEPYVQIFHDGKRKKTEPIRISLQNLQNYFPDNYLLRVHSSFMINSRKVIKNSPVLIDRGKRDFSVQLSTKAGSTELVPIGRSYLPKLRLLYQEWFSPKN